MNKHALLTCSTTLLLSFAANAQNLGRLTGSVVDAETGKPLEGTNVTVKDTKLGAATDRQGLYTITHVPPGSYTVFLSSVGYADLEIAGVVIKENETARLDMSLRAQAIPFEEMTVFAASKRPERITEAPSAISAISATEVRRLAATGQVPKLFEAEPGIDLVQNGVNDFNINARGFNSALNRRMLVLVDNREPSILSLGAQEWNTLSFPLEDLERLEIVRGPGSALYGANAFSGVMNLITPAPKEVLGAKIALSAGELATRRADVRYAGLKSAWSYKLNLGYVRSGSWDKSRTSPSDLEYAGLRTERVPIAGNMSSAYGSARLDRDFSSGAVLTMEGGLAQARNQIFITSVGRVQVKEVNRPWGRTTYASNRFFFQADYSGRRTAGGHQVALSSGNTTKQFSDDLNFQFQHNFFSFQKKLRLIWGAAQKFQHLDTDNTAIPEVHNENKTGLFAQISWRWTNKVELLGATRVDRSTLHDPQFSPKLALVFSPAANHTFRATFNQAFQSPNYLELYARVLAGAPVNLAPLEADIEEAVAEAQGLPPGSVDLPLNFGTTPVRALGNENLQVEKVVAYELGYKGILAKRLFVTMDVYFNRLKDFITNLLPQVNPAYPAYRIPAEIDLALQPLIMDALRAGLGANYPLLSTLPGGSPAFVLSFTNAGAVEAYGFESGLNYGLTNEILLSGNYSFFDFNINDQAFGDKLLPNTPKHKLNLGLSYTDRQGLDIGVRFKYINEYDWANGVFQGKIPSYALITLAAGYQLERGINLRMVVTNLLNDQHYELFGGSVIGRQAIGSVVVEF